jgi:YegS/Rv2252/BmrU family lipid kinase
MAASRAAVIINPRSGHGRYQRQIDADISLAREVLAARGLEAIVRTTTQPGDARTFAEEAANAGLAPVIAWGGDGTVNEVATGLVNRQVPLAIVPAGSGNGLASDLGLPFERRAALEVAAAGRTIAIDAGQVDESLFFNIAGVGIDAVIAARFARRGQGKRGFAGYLQLSASELLRYRCQSYQLEIDGDVVEHRALLVAIANGRQYGNRLLIAPGARLDDGLLEVVVVGDLSLLGIAWRLPALFRGTLAAGRGVTMRAARSLRLRTDGEVPYHVDGEPRLASRELVARVLPKALLVNVQY